MRPLVVYSALWGICLVVSLRQGYALPVFDLAPPPSANRRESPSKEPPDPEPSPPGAVLSAPSSDFPPSRLVTAERLRSLGCQEEGSGGAATRKFRCRSPESLSSSHQQLVCSDGPSQAVLISFGRCPPDGLREGLRLCGQCPDGPVPAKAARKAIAAAGAVGVGVAALKGRGAASSTSIPPSSTTASPATDPSSTTTHPPPIKTTSPPPIQTSSKPPRRSVKTEPAATSSAAPRPPPSTAAPSRHPKSEPSASDPPTEQRKGGASVPSSPPEPTSPPASPTKPGKSKKNGQRGRAGGKKKKKKQQSKHPAGAGGKGGPGGQATTTPSPPPPSSTDPSSTTLSTRQATTPSPPPPSSTGPSSTRLSTRRPGLRVRRTSQTTTEQAPAVSERSGLGRRGPWIPPGRDGRGASSRLRVGRRSVTSTR